MGVGEFRRSSTKYCGVCCQCEFCKPGDRKLALPGIARYDRRRNSKYATKRRKCCDRGAQSRPNLCDQFAGSRIDYGQPRHLWRGDVRLRKRLGKPNARSLPLRELKYAKNDLARLSSAVRLSKFRNEEAVPDFIRSDSNGFLHTAFDLPISPFSHAILSTSWQW